MNYIVSYNKFRQLRREIGLFESFSDAEKAARKAGAIGEGRQSGTDYFYEVLGHEGDDDFEIRIEGPIP